MSLFRGFTIMMGANVALLVLSFLNNKLLYVYLDREANGVFFLAVRLSLFTALLCGDWLRLSSYNLAGGDRSLRGPLSANIIWYSLGLGCILAILTSLVFFRTGARPFGIPPAYAVAAAAAAAFIILRDSSQTLLLVNRRETRYGMTIIVLGSVFLVLDFVFVVICGFGLAAVATAWIIATAASAFYAFGANAADTGLFLRPSPRLFARSGGLGFKALFAVVGMFLMINIHTFAIEPIAGGAGSGLLLVAVFSVCFRVFQLFQRVADVTGSLLLSHVVGDDRETGYHKTAATARAVFLFSVVVSVFALAAGKHLVHFVADEKYTAAAGPLFIMLPGIAAVTVGSVLNSYYWGRGYPAGVIAVPYAAAGIGFVLDIFLIPRLGVGGATLAFSIVNIIWAAWIICRFRRDSGLRLRDLLVPRVGEIRNASAALIRSGRKTP